MKYDYETLMTYYEKSLSIVKSLEKAYRDQYYLPAQVSSNNDALVLEEIGVDLNKVIRKYGKVEDYSDYVLLTKFILKEFRNANKPKMDEKTLEIERLKGLIKDAQKKLSEMEEENIK